MLKFSPANAKTDLLLAVKGLQKYLKDKRKVYSLDLLAGKTCPGAKDCKSQVVEDNGRYVIKDGKDTEFRCFSASIEVRSPAARRLHEWNTNLIRGCGQNTLRIERLLEDSLPPDLGILRYHVSGDWFQRKYLMAAYALAYKNPDKLFYCYTKSLHFLCTLPTTRADLVRGVILPNFLFTASLGGKYDSLIKGLGIRQAVVLTDLATNKVLAKRTNPTKVPSGFPYGGYPIDHDDSHAAMPGGNFALMLHTTQPAGSKAAEVLSTLKGKGSYARK